MSNGIKFDQDKTRMELLPPFAQEEIAKVLTYGARKYDPYNWAKGMPWTRVYGAALRHLNAFARGEDTDPETGLSHVAHAACNLMFLLEYERFHPELDDRYGKKAERNRTGVPTRTSSEVEVGEPPSS
jgi:Domain of unknown function (DUF5664)